MDSPGLGETMILIASTGVVAIMLSLVIEAIVDMIKEERKARKQ